MERAPVRDDHTPGSPTRATPVRIQMFGLAGWFTARPGMARWPQQRLLSVGNGVIPPAEEARCPARTRSAGHGGNVSLVPLGARARKRQAVAGGRVTDN